MMNHKTEPNWTAWIAVSATAPVLVAGLWLLNSSNREAEPPVTIATSCTGFAVDAHKLFDKGDTSVLSGTFASGDHVHLAIDFRGLGYSWQLTDALAKTPDVTGDGLWSSITRSTKSPESGVRTIVETDGHISGSMRLDVELDVTNAGEGAITINRAGSVSLIGPRVVSASCETSTKGLRSIGS